VRVIHENAQAEIVRNESGDQESQTPERARAIEEGVTSSASAQAAAARRFSAFGRPRRGDVTTRSEPDIE
jgi:hypothetical protein